MVEYSGTAEEVIKSVFHIDAGQICGAAHKHFATFLDSVMTLTNEKTIISRPTYSRSNLLPTPHLGTAVVKEGDHRLPSPVFAE